MSLGTVLAFASSVKRVLTGITSNELDFSSDVSSSQVTSDFSSSVDALLSYRVIVAVLISRIRPHMSGTISLSDEVATLSFSADIAGTLFTD